MRIAQFAVAQASGSVARSVLFAVIMLVTVTAPTQVVPLSRIQIAGEPVVAGIYLAMLASALLVRVIVIFQIVIPTELAIRF